MSAEVTERALIARDVLGNYVVLATDGATTEYTCDEVSSNAEEIGLIGYKERKAIKEDADFFYLWTGTWKPVRNREEVQLDPFGTLRPVRPEEVAELYAMVPESRGDDDDGPDDTDRGGY